MNPMKKFETPEIDVIRFNVEDILTTSNPDELPIVPLNELPEV